MKPTISIITPTFNFERYIDKCIESVQRQTFSNWEMIIVDDGSSDNTVKVVKKYLSLDPRIKLITHKKNWGVKQLKKTYNQALLKSKGKYIAILEGDDFWPEYKLDKQVKDFDNNKVVLSFGDSVFTDGSGRGFDILTYNQDREKLSNNPISSILYLFTDLNFYLSPVTVLIRKSALSHIGGFKNSSDYYFVDFPTWLHLSLEGTFVYKKDILGFYRRHEKSSWLDFAKQTRAMTRQEMQTTLLYFLSKKRIKFKRKYTYNNFQNIIKTQKKIISKKYQNRELSFLLHNMAYGKDKSVIKHVFVIFSQKNITNKIKFISFLALLIIPLRKWIMSILFLIKLNFYRYNQFKNAPNSING
ncbi:hypothetical protein A3A93_05880 [Candidatus Roizmanbacteria bacterium RIFCSPLOWO2_01_FULL_38_12]|uniref:Glycosyltransferase 2-like domain-containing protein n=1 Tax=Candidatus Roizmanbacteria bacterium RIFCSPLOWO2_01_FULL_38_12 TaxID=1802061 RepID=A0A1F7IV99_9BACT|nr:MAG: hypothetical protein A3F59_00020 [Candidatus Roizmanbacteria bacterium RIFCSPHIGHO2_12_FULL_38_13]OGK47288.1 MAG: hypothetical protein A3A93_05880 [Candidatus Roizmanbacteria bacterium RIFCSPLOWO2_01_FULL_38_12]